ncbi:DUF4124 domain-containing protein [Shewanella glacialipiscicola]|uniref:DUF4124 domain-containing protein n=1 Tax=Shewanella morhuae TaxID=365591 RepID=A0A1N6UQU5_9GAMM|nr:MULTISPECIES: DUF4124 domain-containing protein [Shewanella]MCU7994364.1 DUF4124 domain-containing protein [Shewanella glacialipiscicola]MCU8025835.1 DUF4124 domain-containing protein [Shewanella glacialipiscicola]SIQ67841.1 protein of unknown function [Shewanella morhuae]SUI85670.1 Uncharacterised protein [Shewanella morhuae]
MRSLTLIGLMLFSMLAQAVVYKWVDKDGKVHYSDEPQPNAQIVELKDKTLNQISLPLPKTDMDDANQAIESIQYQVDITSPSEEETVRNNNGDFEVVATITPELKGQYLMAIKLDGKPIGQPQIGNVFQLKNIDRGQHTLVVDAMTQNGKVFASSPPRKIFLHQATKR